MGGVTDRGRSASGGQARPVGAPLIFETMIDRAVDGLRRSAVISAAFSGGPLVADVGDGVETVFSLRFGTPLDVPRAAVGEWAWVGRTQ